MIVYLHTSLKLTSMKNILLIDDNDDNRENFSEILELSGYRVTAVSNGDAGLKEARNHPPDLILCDVQMNLMTGFEVKEKLNDLHKQDIPFIFLTACSAPHEIQKGKELGASAYLIKPLEMSTILEMIETFISPAVF